MKRIDYDYYFGEAAETLIFSAFGIPFAFFTGWIIYGITWRILRALEKPYPDHLFWWIMLGLGALLVGFLLVRFLWCFFNFIKELFRRAHIRRQCRTKGHDWDNLLHCRRCEEVKPHTHKWDGCRCTLCGEVRNEEHDWSGCKCVRCGMKRDEGHDWKIEACPNCGGSGYVTRSVSSAVAYQEYSWGDYEERCGCEHPLERVCMVCGKREDVSEQK
ncbi:MAG TPA: hypothetical protein VN417_01380 [Candidatus Cryosericum sp.]|nr:hypothetical protein [Candidatus Cryosericum sp.]